MGRIEFGCSEKKQDKFSFVSGLGLSRALMAVYLGYFPLRREGSGAGLERGEPQSGRSSGVKHELLTEDPENGFWT